MGVVWRFVLELWLWRWGSGCMVWQRGIESKREEKVGEFSCGVCVYIFCASFAKMPRVFIKWNERGCGEKII